MYRMNSLNLFVISLLSFVICAWCERDGCLSAERIRLDSCTQDVFQKSPGWRIEKVCNEMQPRAECDNNSSIKDICKRHFRLSIFNQHLFAITMKNTLLRMLGACCGDCATCHVTNVINDQSEFDTTILGNSDVIFPVIGSWREAKLYGFYFLPTFRVPSSYYFTMKKSNHRIMEEVIDGGYTKFHFPLKG